ncbi:MAG: hypothetical protein AMJ91_07115 [candidate division Zixibacteria bacterium SM23_73_3]|nr:MAG: hypothetical protein AMJ91_07115 [candidate division Zixibacteria bacterium SM23_73_3]
MRKKTKPLWRFYGAIFFLLTLFISADIAVAYERYTLTSKAEVSGKGMREFHIIAPANLGGKITMQVRDEDVCLVEFECWAKAKNSKMAKEFTELVDMYLEREEEVVTLRLSTPRGAPWEGTNYGIGVSLDIYVPPDIVVESKTSGFDLDILGPLKKAYIRNRYGNIQLKEVTEETDISGAYNKVEVEDIQGYLEIETSYNLISVRNVNTKGGKAFLKTSYGKIEVEEFTGQLEANTVYSPIRADNITLLGGTNEIKTVYSKIDLEFEEIRDCELYVKNTYGNINVVAPVDLSARLTLSMGRGGKIQTNGILIKPLALEKTRLEGICGDGDSEIVLDIGGIGKILVEGR